MIASKALLKSVALAGGVAGGSLYLSQSSNSSPLTLLSRSRPAAFAAAPATGATSGPFGNPAHQLDYYGKCMIGGILSCGLTHLAVTPLDVIKCRMQTMPDTYKSIGQGFSLASKEGALFVGWLPTLIGYSAQGFFKFGLYEIFKDLYSSIVGEPTATNYKTFVFLAASASAEFFADIALSPLEAIKVKMQTSPPSAKFPLEIGPAYARIVETSGVGGLYAGVVPLWGRQIPYTMVKFAAFENIVNAFYQYVFTEGKSNYSKNTQLGITFASGYIAGVFCAVVSHPADTLVSKLNQSPELGISGIVAKIGFGGLWKGLGMRIFMVGTLTGLQWYIYDTFKVAVGLQASGGSAAPVKK